MADSPCSSSRLPNSVLIQNDFIAALSAYNKARSQVSLTDTVEQRQHGLYDSKATSLREWQQAQADFDRSPA